MENVRNCLRLEFTKSYERKKIKKQQSKLAFIGIHKSYENCSSSSFVHNEVQKDKPVYLGLAVLELSKLHMCVTYCDKLRPYFGQEILHLFYMDTDSFILSVNTNDIIEDLKNSEDIIDFSNLFKNHELFSNKNEKVIGKLETPESIWIDEFICLRSKA